MTHAFKNLLIYKKHDSLQIYFNKTIIVYTRQPTPQSLLSRDALRERHTTGRPDKCRPERSWEVFSSVRS